MIIKRASFKVDLLEKILVLFMTLFIVLLKNISLVYYTGNLLILNQIWLSRNDAKLCVLQNGIFFPLEEAVVKGIQFPCTY